MANRNRKAFRNLAAGTLFVFLVLSLLGCPNPALDITPTVDPENPPSEEDDSQTDDSTTDGTNDGDANTPDPSTSLQNMPDAVPTLPARLEPNGTISTSSVGAVEVSDAYPVADTEPQPITG